MGIVGLILGVISFKGDNGGRGMAIAGVVLSIICLSLATLTFIGCSACRYSTNSFIDGLTDSDIFDSNDYDSYFN